MNPSAVNIAVVDGKTITEAVDLSTAKVGQPVRIKAIKDGKYILAEGEKGVAPENITVKRVGKDLHLSLEGSEEPQLIIEGFYEQGGQLVGVAEDGAYYQYISSDAEQDHEAAFLMDGDSSALVLGSDKLIGFGDGLVAAAGAAWFLPALLGLGALGLAGAAYAIGKSGRDDGDNGGGVRVGAPAKPAMAAAGDDVGAVTGPIAKGGMTDDKSPTFSGIGQPGNTVEIWDNGAKIGEAVVKDDGTWEFTPGTPLPEGAHNIVVVEKGPGGTSEPSDGFDFIIDTVAPGKSSITDAYDDVGTVIGSIPRDGSYTDDARPTLSGEGEPGARIDVYANGEKIGTTMVGADGKWSYTPEADLADGSYDFTTVAVDAAGNAGLPSDPYIVVIRTPPEKGSVGTVTDDAGAVTGPIENGGSTDDTTPTFAGGGTPGDIVTIIDNGSGQAIGSTVVGDDGTWTFTPETPLPEGPTEIVVVITDPVTGESGEPSDPWIVVVDTQTPVQPIIGAVLDDQGDRQGNLMPGEMTDDAQPTFSGTAEAGSTVYIYDNGGTTPIGSAVVGTDGKWTYTPESALPAGPHVITVVTQDAAGNVSPPSTGFDFTVIPVGAPSAPILDSVYDDQGETQGNLLGQTNPKTDDDQPLLTGRAEIGSLIIIYDNGVAIGSVVATNGTWSFTPVPPLAIGQHQIAVAAQNGAGNLSPQTPAFDFEVVSGGAPAAPAILGVTDDIGAVQGNVAKDTGVTDDTRPTINGTAEPGSMVTVYVNDMPVGTVQADANGNWSLIPNQDLLEGVNNISAKATNAAGNDSPETGDYTITVDTTAPNAVSMEVLTDDVGPFLGPIVDGDTTDDNTPTFTGPAGSAEVGTLINVYDTVGGVTTLIGSAVVQPDGSWSFTPSPALVDGAHSFHTVVQDAAGNQSAPSDPIDFTVDTRAVMVSIESATDDVDPNSGALASGDSTNDTTPTLNGQATANAIVNIYLDGVLVGSAQVGADGRWQYTQSPALSGDAVYNYTATVVTDAGGESAPTAQFTLELDTTPPDTGNGGGIGDIIDDVGANQGSIVDGGSTDDTTPTLIGSGQKPGDIVHIIDNGNEIGSAVVGADGSWSFTPETGRLPGEHEFTIIVEDEAGNRSDESDPYTVTIDVTAPNVPSLDSVFDDVGGSTGELVGQTNPITDDDQPTMGGMAEPGSIVYITDTINGVATIIGSATADATTGAWTFTPNPALAQGAHSITVAAKDAAGNMSGASPSFDFGVVSGGAPAAPAILGVTDDFGDIVGNVANNTGVTDDVRPEINGTSEPNVLVTVYVNDVAIGSVMADANGNWSLTPNVDLVEGVNNISAKATNAAGNESPETGDYVITVDTTAPGVVTMEDLNDNVGPITGSITDGTTTDDNTPTFTGQAGASEAGSIVFIYDNGGTTPIGSAVVQGDGSWSFTPTTPLADGPHSLTAAVKDVAGNMGAASDPIDFTVDTRAVMVSIESATDDVDPNSGALASGDSTNDTTPTLNGQATANAIVNIYLDGVLVGSAQVGADGRWQYTQSPALSGDAVYNYTATVVTDAGGESAPTAQFTLELDTTPPDTGNPGESGGIGDVIDDVGANQGSIADGGSTDDTTPTLIGDGQTPGDIIHIIDNGTEIGSTVVGADGSWSFTPDTGRGEGSHDFTIIVEDDAGNLSDPSGAYTVIIDVTAPNVPTLDSVFDDVGGSTGELVGQTNPITDDDQPAMGGIAEPGSIVYITDTINGVSTIIGSATADATTGAWSFTPNPALALGPHSITVTAKDAAGNMSGTSPAFGFEVVSDVAPAVPVISGVTDDVGLVQGGVANTGVTDDVRPEINGTSEPNVLVTVYVNDVAIGSVMADANGNWSLTPNVDLVEGVNNISAKATNAAGNESPETSDYTITVDITAPNPVTLEQLSDNFGPIVGVIADGTSTDDNAPTFTGQAGAGEAGSIVFIYDNGGTTPIGSAVVQADGSWSFTPNPTLVDGQHAFHTVVQDAAGNRSTPSDPIGFIVDTRVVMVTIDSALDDEGGVIGQLGSGSVTDDTSPTLSGRATADSYVNIYLDGVLQGTATVLADGTWTYTQDPVLAGDRSYNYTATVVTEAAGESAPTSAFNLILDTTPPDVGEPGQPGGIGAILDDFGNPNGATETIADGGLTNDTSPTVTGTGRTQGEIVHVRRDGVEVGTAVVQPNGTWSFPDSGLVNGTTYGYTIAVEDAAGNMSGWSTTPYVITVDTTAPNKPTLDMVADNVGADNNPLIPGEVTDDNTPTFSGTAEGDSIVYVYDIGNGTGNPTLLGSTTAQPNGNWTFTPGTALVDGSYNIAVTAKDAAGNESAQSDAFNFTVTTVVTPPVFSVGDGFQTLQQYEFAVGQTVVSTHIGGAPTGVLMTLLSGTAKHVDIAAGNVSYDHIAVDQGSTMKFDVPAATALKISAPSGVHPEASNITCYNAQGEVIPVTVIPSDGVGIGGTVFIAPAGEVIEWFVADPTPYPLIRISGLAWDPADRNSETSDVESNAHISNDELGAIALLDENETYDFTQLAQESTNAPLQVIDLTGTGDNTLKLSVNDVLANGEADLFHDSGKQQLKIEGNEGDMVDLQGLLGTDDSGQWLAQGQITAGGKVYEVYQHSAGEAELLIEQGVQTNLV